MWTLTHNIHNTSLHPPTDFAFDGVELLLFQVIPQHHPVAAFLLHGELPEGEAPHPAVARRHAQGAAALRGHAGEALPPVEVVHRHALEVNAAAAQTLGRRLEGRWSGEVGTGQPALYLGLKKCGRAPPPTTKNTLM